jgi:ABC-type glycerol-3-phosphate transport system permease component
VIFDKIISSQQLGADILAVSSNEPTPQNFQNAAVILVALPVIMVYPFVQKYFVKGILVGSVKE